MANTQALFSHKRLAFIVKTCVAARAMCFAGAWLSGCALFVCAEYFIRKEVEKMKKVLSILLALCLLVGALPVFTFAAEDDFVIEDGVLTKYNGPGGDVVVPDGVTSISGIAFEGRTDITSVTIPASVTFLFLESDVVWMGPFYGCDSIAEVIVDPGNSTFASVDGVLYSKDMKTLLYCPPKLTPNEGKLVIPDGVTTIHKNVAFHDKNDNIVSIAVPASVTSIPIYPFSGCKKLSEISVNRDNAAYTSVDGVLYTKDMKELITYPAGKPSATFTAPSGVTIIRNSAFSDCKSLTDIKLQDGVKEIKGSAFGGCTSLASLTIPSSVKEIYYAFNDDCTVKDVYYGGTKEQWKQINFTGSEYQFKDATIHFKTTPSTGFTDVKPGAYYAEAVKWAVENGITSGIGGGKFAPAQTCKREQIVTFLYRSKGSPQVSITDQFTDMPKSEEFQQAISWAVENSITMGNGKGQFSPEKGCTRAEAMTFIWRAAGRPEPKTEAAFSDMPSSSDFRKAISWAVENNITQGIGNNKFGPNNRGHIVTFLYNAKDL